MIMLSLLHYGEEGDATFCSKNIYKKHFLIFQQQKRAVNVFTIQSRVGVKEGDMGYKERIIYYLLTTV